MTLTEAYSFLFTDILMDKLVFPIQGEVAFTAMRIFGGYNMALVIALATLGTFIAAILNYYLGRITLTATKYTPPQGRASVFVGFLVKYSPVVMLLFGWIPIFGSVLTVAAGLANASARFVIPALTLSSFIYFIHFSLI